MCINWKVVAGLAAAAGAVLFIQPTWFPTLGPILLIAACPISMLLMLRTSRGDSSASAPPGRNDEVDSLRAEIVQLRQQVDGLRSSSATSSLK
jgi:hypothetical protein